MYKSKSVGTVDDQGELLADFGVVIAGQNAYNRSHWPGISRSLVWPSDGTNDRTLHEVRIAVAEQ